MNTAVLMRELAATVDAPVLDGDAVAPYLLDATEARGLHGRADAVVLAKTRARRGRPSPWRYEHDPLTARGGAADRRGRSDGGVVVALAGLRSVRSIEPLQCAAEIESGEDAGGAAGRARERALLPARPRRGRAVPARGERRDQRRRPHAFKYGVTGAWVTSRGRDRPRRVSASWERRPARTSPGTTCARC